MTFAEILQEVYNLTSRPDLDTLTKSAVKAATLKAHQSDFYSKDLVEESFTFSGDPRFLQSLDTFVELPNYRALKYVRRVDGTENTPNTFIEVLSPAEVIDQWGRERVNVAYVAGADLKIKSSVEFTTIILGYYTSPIVVEANYSSWVADSYPYTIIYEAARVIFSTKSQDAEKNSMATLVSEQYAELKINAVSDVGS